MDDSGTAVEMTRLRTAFERSRTGAVLGAAEDVLAAACDGSTLSRAGFAAWRRLVAVVAAARLVGWLTTAPDREPVTIDLARARTVAPILGWIGRLGRTQTARLASRGRARLARSASRQPVRLVSAAVAGWTGVVLLARGGESSSTALAAGLAVLVPALLGLVAAGRGTVAGSVAVGALAKTARPPATNDERRDSERRRAR